MRNALLLFTVFFASLYCGFAQQTDAQSQVENASRSLRPAITHKEKAKYTQAALELGVHGTLILSAVFQADGKITQITPITSLPQGLTEMAIEAAKKIRFKPGMKDGKPVSVRMSMEFTFALDYQGKNHQKRVIAFAFPFLTNESIDKLAQAFDKYAPDSKQTDIWLVACEKRGMKHFSKAEQGEFNKLHLQALQLLSPEKQKIVQRIMEKEQDDKIEDSDLYALSRLIFEGISLSSAENQKRFAELHNQAVLSGLQQFQGK